MVKKAILEHKTQRGRQIITRAMTDVWEVVKESDTLPMGVGPWMLISPDGDANHPLSRWVMAGDDRHFHIHT